MQGEELTPTCLLYNLDIDVDNKHDEFFPTISVTPLLLGLIESPSFLPDPYLNLLSLMQLFTTRL